MSSTPVSALVITKNEERYIARCLKSLDWAQEIIVVDAESTDRTAEIARSLGAKVITQPWLGFSEQRNVALRAASNEWVYFADADEECTPELIARIQSLTQLPGGPPEKRYRVHRKEFFLGKEIRHGMWNPVSHDRFYSKKNAHFEGGIHERLVHPSEPSYLSESCNHDLFLDTDKFLSKLNRYSTLQAEEDVAGGIRTNIWRLSLSFPHMFFKHLFYYNSYRDGMHGVIISLLEAVYRVVRHIKIWEIQNGYGRYQTTQKNR